MKTKGKKKTNIFVLPFVLLLIVIIAVAKTTSLSYRFIFGRRRLRFLLRNNGEVGTAASFLKYWNQYIFRDGGQPRLPMHRRFTPQHSGFSFESRRHGRRCTAGASNTTPVKNNFLR